MTAFTALRLRAPMAAHREQLRRALDEERQRNLRLLADLENFRRRAGREQETGWRLGDDLLRPAQVVVASPTEAIHRWR
jgi:molecular chaperone GrpE (heat shock protein)